ncbi:MAG: hypothetical protein WCI77_10940 [Candidatus Omnitrophota bacterium]
MNKKQLIVLWAMGILVCLIILLTPKICFVQNSYFKYDKNWAPVINWGLILSRSLIVIIIGGLAFYTLKDKK